MMPNVNSTALSVQCNKELCHITWMIFLLIHQTEGAVLSRGRLAGRAEGLIFLGVGERLLWDITMRLFIAAVHSGIQSAINICFSASHGQHSGKVSGVIPVSFAASFLACGQT